MFELDPDSEVTQVDFWTSYRDVFAQFSPALGASDLPSVRGASFPAPVLTSYGDVPMTP